MFQANDNQKAMGLERRVHDTFKEQGPRNYGNSSVNFTRKVRNNHPHTRIVSTMAWSKAWCRHRNSYRASEGLGSSAEAQKERLVARALNPRHIRMGAMFHTVHGHYILQRPQSPS